MNVTPNYVDLLTRVDELLKSGWTFRAAARDGSGRPCHERQVGARSFCLVGAVSRVTTERVAHAGVAHLTAEVELQARLTKATAELYPGVEDLIELNDTLGRDATLAVVRLALERARAEVVV